MKLKVNTATFQNMVAKAVKGAGMSNDYAITHQMAIQLKDNMLTLITTDFSNYLYIKSDNISGEDFYVVVPVSKFSKLVSKLTCDETVLEVVSTKGGLDMLEVKGNGRHTIELGYDEEGELIEFPDPLSDSDNKWTETTTNLSTIKLILSTAKPALYTAKDKSLCYNGYYMADKIVATDTFKVCGIDIKMFDTPKLMSPETIDLLDVMTEEDITVRCSDDIVVFSTDTVDVYGHVKAGVEEYQIGAISSLLDEKFPSSCKVDKSSLLQILDRLSLFVDTIDKNSVYLTFTKDGLLISNKRDRGEELLPYKSSVDFQDYTCCLDITLFTTQVKACPADVIEILYGKSSLKFVEGATKQILALAEDDREGND